VFILDPWWNPAVEQQAIDRTHRIGQKNTVFIYKFITKNSVEEKILALQERKRRIADSLITTEESFIKSLSEEDIRSILE
jgi:SNF2 family DNA or RNA helicase